AGGAPGSARTGRSAGRARSADGGGTAIAVPGIVLHRVRSAACLGGRNAAAAGARSSRGKLCAGQIQRRRRARLAALSPRIDGRSAPAATLVVDGAGCKRAG